MVEIWESKIKDEKSSSLPIIIPLVIYHGRERWNIRTTLGEMIEGYENLTDDIKAFIPNYEYLLYDISRYRDEDIKGIAQLRIILTIFRDIFIKDKECIKQTITLAGQYLRELEDRETGVEYFETFFKICV
jgi:putative YhgA-like transposase